MSVTIISTLPKPTQATAAEKTANNDNAASVQDFASLLLGQLAPMVPEIPPETTVKTGLPATDATVSDAAPTDAASLFAALGLVPPVPGHGTDTSMPDIGKSDIKTSDSSSALQTTTAVGLSLEQESKAKPISSSALQTTTAVGLSLEQESKAKSTKTEPLLTGMPAADDKPAKFAASPSVAISADTVFAKNVSTETLPNTIPALTSNLHVHHEAPLSVSTTIREQSWAGDFAQKIVWLATNDKQTAQITLNPPQMGPIEISLNIDKGSATAVFVSANAEVRDAIETALPRLREMFASAGIELGQTNVSSESFRQQPGSGDGNRGSAQWKTDNAILVAGSVGSLPGRAFSAQSGNGMVDIFA